MSCVVCDIGIPQVCLKCNDALFDSVARLQNQNAQMLAALEAVEWQSMPGGETVCIWCIGMKHDGGHEDDCRRQTAIAAAKGEDQS